MAGFIKKSLQNNILRNVATLISGTAVAQLLLIGFQLILRRLYEPEDFTAFSVYMSTIGILVIVSTLRYELAVVLPKKDKTGNSLFVGGVFLSFMINVLVLLVILFFKSKIIVWLNFPVEYQHWLYFIPLSTFLLSSYQMINFWLTRNAAFKSIAINKVMRRSAEGVTQSAIGLKSFSFGLLAGDLIGNVAHILSGIKQMLKHSFSLKGITKQSVRSALKEYGNFPKYQAFPAILNTMAVLLPVFLINKYYIANSVAYFDFSRQILDVPTAFITAALSQVLLKEYSNKRKNQQQIMRGVLKTSSLLALAFLPFLVLIAIWGPEIFSFVFTEKWINSGRYSQILIFAFAIQFIVSPISIVFTVLEELKILAAWQILFFLSIASLFFFKHWDMFDFLRLYTMVVLIAYTIYFLLILYVCRKYDKSLLNNAE